MSYSEAILIVDDEPRMCDSLKDLLSSQSYKIKTCCNGYDALECLLKDTFGLVLLDIGMEQMDGFQVMEGMKRQYLNIPVIIMTGNASTASAVEALRRGAHDYLRKPFEAEELYNSVKNALNQKKLEQDNRLAKKKLQESEERFRQLAENAKDMIYRMSLPEGQYTYVSPASIDLFGYTPDEFYQAPMIIQKVIHPDWMDYFKEQWAKLVSGDMPPFFEYQIIHKSGKEKWLHQRNALICDNNGQPKAIEGVVSDITERKEAEAARSELEAQNTQLQKAESLSRMAGAIAHHFNNQLMVVMGNLEMVMGDLSKDNPHLGNLTRAMTAIRKAGEVSFLMLTYLGQQTANKELVDMGELCRRSLPLIRTVLPRTILLTTDFPPAGPTINGNVNQIQQVLTNLITNAGEAVADGPGLIHLSVKMVSFGSIPKSHRYPIDCQPQDTAYACLEVKDTGCGIAEKDIEKIFDPFFTSKFTGRGLGLPVVLGIVRAHRGLIAVESKTGRGSIFRVFLPVSADAVIRPPEKTIIAPKA